MGSFRLYKVVLTISNTDARANSNVDGTRTLYISVNQWRFNYLPFQHTFTEPTLCGIMLSIEIWDPFTEFQSRQVNSYNAVGQMP